MADRHSPAVIFKSDVADTYKIDLFCILSDGTAMQSICFSTPRCALCLAVGGMQLLVLIAA
jgi:hypothetical protein